MLFESSWSWLSTNIMCQEFNQKFDPQSWSKLVVRFNLFQIFRNLFFLKTLTLSTKISCLNESYVELKFLFLWFSFKIEKITFYGSFDLYKGVEKCGKMQFWLFLGWLFKYLKFFLKNMNFFEYSEYREGFRWPKTGRPMGHFSVFQPKLPL